MVFRWIRNLRIRGGKLPDNHHSLVQLENLLPGVYYRIVLEPEFSVTHLGEGIFDLLGYKSKELLNKNTMSYLRFVHPGHKEIISQKKILCGRSHEANTLLYHLITKARSVKLIEDHFIGEYDRLGHLIAINGYFKEVRRSSVKLQLLNQLEAFRGAIDVNLISSITDVKGTIIYANDNFKRISQYNDEELLGKSHRIVSSGSHSRSFFEDMWQTITSGSMWCGEILNRAKDGSLYWVATVIIPVFNEGNTITSYLSLCTLITEQKHAEEQRDKYIRVLEDIAHVVAHDIRGPICSILGLVNVVEKIDCREHDLKPTMDYLVYEVNKLDQITRKLSARIYSAILEMKAKESVLPTQAGQIEK